ncbi:MAG: hypothetical protein L0Y54_00625, partial [Sporichthyaceae bacterium]|nr:hypothetical protein [Sporichthyaceae bacterium]
MLHYPTCASGEFVSDLDATAAAAAGLVPLADLLAGLPAGIGVDLDLKSALEDATRSPELTTAGLLVPVLEAERDRRPNLMVSSFDAGALTIVRELLPAGVPVPLGLLSWVGFPLRKAVPMAAQLGFGAVIAHWKSFAANDIDPAPIHRETAYSVDIAHRAGLRVGAWCPPPVEIPRMAAAGVDALIVNDVAGALAALAALSPLPRSLPAVCADKSPR